MKVKITQPPGAMSDLDGILIVPKKGEEVDVPDELGQALVDAESAEKVVGESSQDASPKPAQQDRGGDNVDATPKAREKAEELGVDISGIEGSGDGGKVTVDDVKKAAEKRDAEEEQRANVRPSETTAANGPIETRG